MSYVSNTQKKADLIEKVLVNIFMKEIINEVLDELSLKNIEPSQDTEELPAFKEQPKGNKIADDSNSQKMEPPSSIFLNEIVNEVVEELPLIIKDSTSGTEDLSEVEEEPEDDKMTDDSNIQQKQNPSNTFEKDIISEILDKLPIASAELVNHNLEDLPLMAKECPRDTQDSSDVKDEPNSKISHDYNTQHKENPSNTFEKDITTEIFDKLPMTSEVVDELPITGSESVNAGLPLSNECPSDTKDLSEVDVEPENSKMSNDSNRHNKPNPPNTFEKDITAEIFDHLPITSTELVIDAEDLSSLEDEPKSFNFTSFADLKAKLRSMDLLPYSQFPLTQMPGNRMGDKNSQLNDNGRKEIQNRKGSSNYHKINRQLEADMISLDESESETEVIVAEESSFGTNTHVLVSSNDKATCKDRLKFPNMLSNSDQLDLDEVDEACVLKAHTNVTNVPGEASIPVDISNAKSNIFYESARTTNSFQITSESTQTCTARKNFRHGNVLSLDTTNTATIIPENEIKQENPSDQVMAESNANDDEFVQPTQFDGLQHSFLGLPIPTFSNRARQVGLSRLERVKPLHNYCVVEKRVVRDNDTPKPSNKMAKYCKEFMELLEE